MPPHCDSLDGPVVVAARRALDHGDADLVLPFVPASGEGEVRHAFESALAVRTVDPRARELADQWFFETVVRVHRAGEGAPYTGLKPAGLDVGPAVPAAERALETGLPEELATLLCTVVREQVVHRLARATALATHATEGVPQAREYVSAALGLQVWAHGVYTRAAGPAHEHGEAHEHPAAR